MVRFGQYPEPLHTIAHLSDTHLLGGGRGLYGRLEQERTLELALTTLERSGRLPEAIVVTGDLADLGEPDAYLRLRALVDPVAERMGSRLIWVMGNHDEREPFASLMREREPSGAPQDEVYDVAGLRVISLDSTVPGYHHGEIEDRQLAWLRDQLAEPAPHGTLLALHHPPIPTPVEVLSILELRDQERLAEVIADTDVIAILGGHLHYTTFSTFAGIPVSVAGATCYTIDAATPPDRLVGVDGGQSINLVEVWSDRVAHSVVPVGRFPGVSEIPPIVVEAFAVMNPAERLEAFSSKASTFDLAAAEALVAARGATGTARGATGTGRGATDAGRGAADAASRSES